MNSWPKLKCDTNVTPEQNSLQFKTYDKFLAKKNNLKTIESRKSLYCARMGKN